MSEQSEQKPRGPEDIDLGKVFQRVREGTVAAWWSFIRFLAMLRRIPRANRASFITITATSLVVAVVYGALLQKEYYESTMILNVTHLNARLLANEINNLDALADEDTPAGLAKALNIPDSVAETVLSFESKPFITEEELIQLELLKLRNESVEAADEGGAIEAIMAVVELQNRASYEIEVRVTNPAHVPFLQTALVEYLKNNEYVKRRLEDLLVVQMDKKQKLIAEMARLDSIQAVIYKNYVSMSEPQSTRSGSNNVILSERSVIDPLTVFNQNLTLFRELVVLNSEMHLRTEFEVVHGFTGFSEPANPSIALLAVIGLLLGLVVAYLDVVVRSINRYLDKVE